MFVDASALTAILLNEPEAVDLAARLDADPNRLVSAIVVFETVRAIMRVKSKGPDDARALVVGFLRRAGFVIAPIDAAEREVALDAMDRFGKGRHPAQLNMGDCFAYACARVNGASLLFKGDDFTKTDISAA